MHPIIRRVGRVTFVLMLAGSLPGRAQAGRAGAVLSRLCDTYWEGTLAANPTLATSLGKHRYDARLEDISPAGIERERLRLEGVLAAGRGIEPNDLSAADRATLAALLLDVQDRLDALSCHDEEWLVDPFNGPPVSLMNLPDVTTIATPRHAADYVRRCRAMGPYLDQHIANLERGVASRRFPAAAEVRRVLRQLDGLGKRPLEQWPLMAPLAVTHRDWPEAARATFRRDLDAAVRDVVRPALARYREFLDRVVMRVARSDERAGLSYLPGGMECYRKRIRIHTSLDLTPEQFHQLGLEQVARIRQELSEVGARVLGTGDFTEIQRRMRDDPALRCTTEVEIEARARATLARARDALPGWFRLQPRSTCEVRVMSDPGPSVLAFYRPAVPGDLRPGYYLIATTYPTSRRRYEAEVLAFHEAIPGHHVQVAIAQERAGLPEFRRHQLVTAFAEGWALYAERLADEMGLYSSDLDRLGMLSYDAWRSCRLVVDTGLNALGWSIPEAADFMTQNSLLPVSEIYDDLDRYLTWPGQALAYKIGQLEILKLREEGRRRLGARFDIQGFHDAVLRNGAVALPVLREQVEAYYEQVEAAR